MVFSGGLVTGKRGFGVYFLEWILLELNRKHERRLYDFSKPLNVGISKFSGFAFAALNPKPQNPTPKP